MFLWFKCFICKKGPHIFHIVYKLLKLKSKFYQVYLKRFYYIYTNNFTEINCRISEQNYKFVFVLKGVHIKNMYFRITLIVNTMKTVHYYDFIKALWRGKSVISSTFGHMLLFDILTPSSIFIQFLYSKWR